MMERAERRKDRRLRARFGVSCHAVGSTADKPCDGRTVNVSSGGLYFETTGTFEPGSLLRVELSIPPTPGLLEFGGRIAGFARVLRAHSIGGSLPGEESSSERYGVAVQFCRPPRLCI
ncbi:MAG: PilZ domain-containing protein [Phycisphaerales bacterium]|nr:MAG: PilZ domain-containing protein [Phycisphaerales bacterium]